MCNIDWWSSSHYRRRYGIDQLLGRCTDSDAITFKRYTGQENNEERLRIIQNPPHILLTNYVMLELLLTRPNESPLIGNSSSLKFLVLDELHTYRGRQGADVSMLVRRLRDRTNWNPICIGTSATLAGSPTLKEQQKEVSDVASRIFGIIPAKPFWFMARPFFKPGSIIFFKG